MAEQIVNTTAEKVRKAAENGPNIEKVLKELFPDAFTIKPGARVKYINSDAEYILVDIKDLEASGWKCGASALPSYDSWGIHVKSGRIYALRTASLKAVE